MKTYSANEMKNIALIGNARAGKTTLAETMMFEGNVISRRGSVEAKNTVSDYNEVEQFYGNSVFSSVLYTEFNDTKLNIIDCPGMDDFVCGMATSLRVVATGVMVINAQNGVEVGTEIAGRYAAKYNKPLMLVVNQVDHEKSNYDATIESINKMFGDSHVAVVQYPVNQGVGYNAMIDVLIMKMFKWGPNGGIPEILDIPADQMEKAEQLHNQLVEKAAENDEKLMDLYFEKGTLTEEEMKLGIKEGMVARSLFPVFCVSALKEMGVRRLMEFIINIAPSPDEVEQMKSLDGKDVLCKESEPTTLYFFKTSIEPHVGEVNFFKVTSGKVTEGMELFNPKKNEKERIAQLFVCAGKNRVKVTELKAGDIGATVKLKSIRLFHTLCDKDKNITLPELTLPEPKYRVVIKAVVEAEEEKVSEVLQKMHEMDPTYRIEYAKELKQLIVSGQGEHHINTLKWHFDNIYKLGIKFETPKIPYRETITKSARADYRHKKQSGGSGQFGEVHLVVEPYYDGMPEPTAFKFDGQEYKISVRGKDQYDLSWGGKLLFYNCIVGGAIDSRFLPAIMKGIMEKMEEGPLTGSYARDIRVCVYDGKMHPVDSNEISFRLAGRNAFVDAFKKANPKILEPIYDLEVWAPSDRLGDVMSDLQGRRAMIEGMSSDKGFEVLKAKVPLKEIDRYSTSLSSITGGRAFFTMKFSSYELVASDVQEALLKEYAAKHKEEE